MPPRGTTFKLEAKPPQQCFHKHADDHQRTVRRMCYRMKSWFASSCLGVPILLFILGNVQLQRSIGVDAFVAKTSVRFESRHDSGSCLIRGASSDDNGLPSNFNPFSYQQEKSKGSSAFDTRNISLRQTQLQQLMGDLLNCNRDAESMREILENNKDFLLEPLEDSENAVVDVDSIYSPEMSRQERYQAYRENVQGRVQKASNPQSRLILQTMMDYVLQFE